MSYAIEPSWFYLLKICGVLKIVVPIVFAVLSGIMLFTVWDLAGEGCWCPLIILSILWIVFLLGTILIPTQDEMIAMKALEIIQNGNQELTVDALKEIIYNLQNL